MHNFLMLQTKQVKKQNRRTKKKKIGRIDSKVKENGEYPMTEIYPVIKICTCLLLTQNMLEKNLLSVCN
jgi:hypothetical protein